MKRAQVLEEHRVGQKWVWSARPDVVLQEDVSDRPDLPPMEAVTW
jgi:hypothetical protein